MSVCKTAGFVLMLVWITLMISPGVSGNIGRDFVVGFFSQYEGYTLGTNNLYLTSRNNTLVRVEVPFLSMNQTYHVTSDNMTTIELNGTVRTSTLTGKEKKGIRVTSDYDIAVYGINLLAFISSDGFLGLPLHMAQAEYIVPSYTALYNSLVGIVASEDNTVVAVTLRTSGTVTYKMKQYRNHETITENMDQLEIFQIACDADLTGTRVMSNRKVSVFSGNEYAIVNFQDYGYLVEQIPAVNQWGTHHVTNPTPMQTAGYIFRVLAAFNKTAISVGGSHASLDQGDFAEYDIPSTDSREILCDKPCLVVKYNKGGVVDSVDTDPFMTILPPVSKYTPAALVATPLLARNDGRYTTYISIVMKTSDTSGLLVDDQLHGLTWETIQGTNFSRTFMIAKKTSYKISHQSEHARFLPLVSAHSKISFGFPGSWYFEICRPILIYPDDVNQTCRDSIAVNVTGFPSVQYSICNISVSFTFNDTFATDRRCPYARQVIRRQFTGVDSFERKYTHEQTIAYLPTRLAKPPSNVRGHNTSSTSILVQWDEVPQADQNGIIVGYRVKYSNASGWEESTQSSGPEKGNQTLEGLNEFTRYNICVLAFTVHGDGPQICILVVTAEDRPAKPPSNVRGHSTSSTSILVQWDEVPLADQNGIILGYRVKSIKSGEQTFKTSSVSGNKEQTLNGLQEFTMYNVCVLAFTASGDGPETCILVVTSADTTDSQKSNISAVVTGSVAGVLALLIIVVLVIVAVCMSRRTAAVPTHTAEIDNPGFECKEITKT